MSAANGSFQGGTYVGTLANGGAVLAPYHDFASQIPSALQTELTTVQTGIENGSIATADQEPGVRSGGSHYAALPPVHSAWGRAA